MLAPPCIRHLPLAIAGDLQGRPRRVRAPHLGAEFGLPGGFPFFNHPLRGVCVQLIGFSMVFDRSIRRLLMIDRTYDALRSAMDMHVLHVHLLSALAPVPV